jgi:protocatechuate 3,4-dioxygenase beta subunit
MGRAGLAAMAFMTTRGVFAEALTETAAGEEGPFYPPKLPLDTDNDLLIVNDAITPAVGEVTHLSGKLLDASGSPIRNAVVEIWQVDSTATYLAERESKTAGFDKNFQGFGRFLTGSTGEYYFRTIKPVPYRGRSAPHIHFKIKQKGREPWTTQLYIKGFPGNERDGVYNQIPGAAARQTVSVDFTPVPGSRAGELAAKFDIIHGPTAG